jgi:DNA-binding NtrC family response regulator
MPGEAVALIRDIDLFEQVERWFRERHQVRVQFAGDAAAALEQLRQQRVPTLLLDCRPEYCDGEAVRLFDRLNDAGLTGLNLVTIGQSILPVSIASKIDLLALEHIPVEAHGIRWEVVAERLPRIVTALRARVLPRCFHAEAGGVAITTYTPEFFPCLEDLLRVTHRDVTLLLVGETGTGKTTLARFIHNRSPRRDRAFQHLACGTLPSDLIESELFGHTRGAFTGAERNKIGRFQAAGHGTLLLDEIDVLDLKQQVKLLRVIETGEYELVGSTETHVSEARLIVASNVNLEELVAAGQFRSDLYYRLNVLEFHLPALRNRPLDIVPWAVQFIEESCREHNISVKGVHRDFLACLKKYRWPGNLRELKNHIRRAVLFCETDCLTVNDLSPKIVQAQFQEDPPVPIPSLPEDTAPPPPPAAPPPSNGHAEEPIRAHTIADRVAQTEREFLEQALRQNGNNRTRTAQALGLSRVGLYKKLRRLGLMGCSE